MRNTLKSFLGQRLRFRATVSRFGTKSNYHGNRQPIPTLLLTHVIFEDSGEIAAEHVWLVRGKWATDLCIGDEIVFDARVDEYEKGYRGYDEQRQFEHPPAIDYRLTFPSQVQRISAVPRVADGQGLLF